MQYSKKIPKKDSAAYLPRLLPALLLISLLSLSLSACGGDPQAQLQAKQNLATLNQAIQHAKSVGVPSTDLNGILHQELQLNQTNAPWSMFNDQSVDDYYHNLATRYQLLAMQTHGVEAKSTEQLKAKAQTDLLSLQRTLTLQRASGTPVDAANQIYQKNAAKIEKASTPGEFIAISKQVHDATLTLNQLPATMDKLKTLQDIITMMQNDHQDVNSLQKQYDDDKSALNKVVTPDALQQVDQTIDQQNQQVASNFQGLIPQLVQNRINDLSDQVQEMQKDGIDVTKYQQTLGEDRTQGQQVKSLQDYRTFSKKIAGDIKALQPDLFKGRAIFLVSQFHQKVNAWGNAHMYHDKYNGEDYPLNNSYMTKGIGEDLDRELNNAQSLEDYQQVIADTQNELFHLQMLEQDFNDSTPFDQVHQTDIQLIDHYKLQNAQVVVVSTVEQSLRLYENGHLVQGFLITAGRPELPAVPGLWRPMWRLTHTEFHSPYPKGSPYYYEPTKINYAIMYHEGGYFLHDSWWRNDYGPGTQFYHIDSSGNTSASYGTHGCVNIREDQAAWLYDRTSYNTSILIY
ncbi:L,D-transpeptidase [Ktedonosporobacter rubrisoli]|uniref:L,D-transpeptidase n=1 Tax=Ktedonosporobacter rubrisoli TaxID=2509675 RepID=A0A4P6JJE5_KTERU|nr:L,D-transpeptidase family protein [Ktedonosporobacter rubrisoli]QBD75219.1 L,D-transpeptidase [Ktedonosporobacter rubrisoli]